MGHAATLGRAARVALAALVLAGATTIGTGEAVAAKSKREDQTSAKTRLTVLGSITEHESCEGQLAVSIALTRKGKQGDRTITRAVTVDDDGAWTTTLTHARETTYSVSATLVGHRSGPLSWPPNTVKTRRGKETKLDLGTLRIAECKR